MKDYGCSRENVGLRKVDVILLQGPFIYLINMVKNSRRHVNKFLMQKANTENKESTNT